MSRTVRKERGTNRKYPEGQNNRLQIRYACRCFYCTGTEFLELKEKIANREMKLELKNLGI